MSPKIKPTPGGGRYPHKLLNYPDSPLIFEETEGGLTVRAKDPARQPMLEQMAMDMEAHIKTLGEALTPIIIKFNPDLRSAVQEHGGRFREAMEAEIKTCIARHLAKGRSCQK